MSRMASPPGPGDEAAVAVEDLWKVFPGGVEALRGVSLRVPRGSIYGVVGPNGAGKTTLFRILATLLRPTRGRALVGGVDAAAEPWRARGLVAYVPEEVGGYRRLTGLEYIRFVVSAHLGARGASGEEIEAAVEEAVEISGLPRWRLERVRMGEYSKGMKRRVQVAWALAVKPLVAILDEPTSGLDVEASYELREAVRRYASSHGVTVLLSSHDMLEVERLCDRVAILRGGRVLVEGTPRGIAEEVGASSLEEAYMVLVRGGGGAGAASG